MNFKIGFGYDVHQLAENEEFWLGGVKIEHRLGTVGHSDADVLIHAIIDALLGAANLRDIGYQFPDTDSEWEGADSKLLLKRAFSLLKDKGYRVGNIDSTVCLQSPKIGLYIPEMIQIIATTLDISIEEVSIKATTSEKIGFVGREEGVTAYAVALIHK